MLDRILVTATPPPASRNREVKPATEAPARPNRLAALDGLRLFAALFVVFFHWVGQGLGTWGDRPMTGVFPWLHPFAQYGWMGVHLFFLISGFVICMSAWGRSLGDFFLSRVVRLYPAFWLSVLATTAVVTLLPVQTHRLPWSQVAFNLTMIAEPSNVPLVDGVYWTLWVELKFYLLFALVVWRGVTYRRVVLFCALWAVASMAATASNNTLLVAVFTPKYSMYFVGGMAFYLMYRFRPTGLLWGIVGFSWLQTQYMMAYQAPLAAATTRSTQHWWISVPLVTVFYAIMASVALGWLSWARWRWLTVAGALTYPLYLLHDVIGFTLIRWLHESIPKWPLLLGLLAAMLLTSWLVHRYFERPVSVRLKRWIQQGLTDIRANELKMRHAADRPLVPEEPTRGRHASTGAPHTRPIGHILVAEHAIAPATNLADP